MYILQAQQDTFSIPEILCIKLTQNEPSATGMGWEDKNNSDQDQLHKLGMGTKRKWVIALCSKWFQETTCPGAVDILGVIFCILSISLGLLK